MYQKYVLLCFALLFTLNVLGNSGIMFLTIAMYSVDKNEFIEINRYIIYVSYPSVSLLMTFLAMIFKYKYA